MKFKSLIKNNPDSSFLIGFTLIYCIFFFFSYARWGLVILDCFHEIYVSRSILAGSHLYKDIFYLYGPFVPYLYSFLFGMFGLNLNIVYILGGIISYIYCFIVILIARKLLSTKETLLVASLLLIVCVFSPVLKGYIFSYSASAPIGNLFAILTLFFLITFLVNQNKKLPFYLSSFFAGFSILIKHEYAFTAITITLISMIIFLIQGKINFKELGLSILIAIFIPSLVYLYFLLYLRVNLIDEVLLNTTFFQSAKYFSLNFLNGGISLNSIIQGSIAFLLITIFFTFGFLYTLLAKWLRNKHRYIPIFLLISVVLVFILLGGLDLIVNFIKNNFLDTFAGLGILNIITLIYLYFFYKDNNRSLLILLSIYSLLIAVRTPFYYSLKGYATFYLPTTFIILVYFIFHILPSIAIFKKLKEEVVSFSYFFIIILSTFFLIYDCNFYARKSSALLLGNSGQIYINPELYPAITSTIGFIKTHTSNKDRIFVVPEEVSLYIFSQRFAPGKFYYLNPGIIDNTERSMNYIINSFNVQPPKYMIVSNLPRDDFGISNILDYYKPVNDYILKHYKKIQVYKTSFPVEENINYSITIYRRTFN